MNLADLSGIEVSQTFAPGPTDYIVPTNAYQTFTLPSNYVRGDVSPDLTGVQLCFRITDANFTATVALDVYDAGDWVSLTTQTLQGSHAQGEYIWIDAYFDAPVRVVDYTKTFRIRVTSPYQLWHSSPPALLGQCSVSGANLLFRVLAATADSDVDFLGNQYRSAVARSQVSNVGTQNTDNINGYWMSKPNPSKFAVEALYFDVRDGHAASVVDRVLIDPITPGVYFNLYYSSEGDAPSTQEEWDSKLWTPVSQSFRADRRREFALNSPVVAKYIKVEFTHLQPQYYQAGTFHQPIRYLKHPKWVLTYFAARVDAQNVAEDPTLAQQVRVVYNGLDLAYNYYLDDLHQEPNDPTPRPGSIVDFLSTTDDKSDRIDMATLEQINLDFRPYLRQPGGRVTGLESVMAQYSQLNIDPNYPVEAIRSLRADTSEVSTLDRMPVLVENNMPVMFFYVTCRHAYRVLEASFEDDKAYFAGVRELAFTRDHYTVTADQDLYVEAMGDFANAYRNDFIDEEYLPFDKNGNPSPPDPSNPDTPVVFNLSIPASSAN